MRDSGLRGLWTAGENLSDGQLPDFTARRESQSNRTRPSGSGCGMRCDVMEENFRWVVPVGTADLPGMPRVYGRGKSPTEYSVTAAIPHLNTIEPLKLVIELLRLQTERPFIMVIDTGSPPEVLAELYELRAEDVEIHSVAAHGYNHSSEPVAVALDVAHALCRTPWLFHTHTDCFPRRRDLLETWARLANVNTPVIGYRMSPRDWITTEWEWMVGHTALMLFMPPLHTIGASWNFQRMHYAFGYMLDNLGGWPDTETGFNHALREAGIKPIFLGFDRNHDRQITDDYDHVRSFSGSSVYNQGSYSKVAAEWMVAALSEARERVEKWKKEWFLPSAVPQLPPVRSDSSTSTCSHSAVAIGSLGSY